MNGKCSVLVAALLAASAQAAVHAQISTREQQAEQDAIDARTPKLNYKEDVLQLLVPGYTMGETVGVDVNSQNHIFVYSRTNPQGIARGGTAAMLWEFDQQHGLHSDHNQHRDHDCLRRGKPSSQHQKFIAMVGPVIEMGVGQPVRLKTRHMKLSMRVNNQSCRLQISLDLTRRKLANA